MHSILSFYKFIEICDLEQTRAWLKEIAAQCSIKGTILIATEGINGSIAGESNDLECFEQKIRQDARFNDLWFKKSHYQGVSFRRMLVKIKKEIITMGLDGRQSLQSTGQYLEPQELKRWLDEEKEFLLVDTRNDYEYELGSFQGAINPNIKTFGAFPAWVNEHLAEHKEKPVVTFCTGGIRCEKATTYMQQQGFKNVYQLHGGILNYFETLKETGELEASHWQGDLVVFDKRQAITPHLEHSQKNICFVCLREIAENSPYEETEAGLACSDCFAKMTAFQKVRQERGLAKQQAYNKRRQQTLQ